MYRLTAIPVALVLTASLMGAAALEEAPPSGPISEFLDDHPETIVVDDDVYGASAVAILGEVSGLRPEAPAPLAACDYRNAAFTNLSGWQESLDGCGIIGFDWTARYSYAWSQDKFAWNSGPSCVQGRGYSTNRTVSTPVWANAGCGASGSVSAFIGNRATVAKIRGHVNAAAKIGYVRWK